MFDWDTTNEGLLHDHSAGCLVGLATGDALGGPVETLTASMIADRYGTLNEMVGGGRLRLEPGETTDNTAQAIALAESLVACSGFVPDDLSRRLAEWYMTDPAGVEAHTSIVLEKIAAGEDWEKAALETQVGNPASAGNGSLLRGVPIALLDHSTPAVLIEHSRLSSRVTHPHSQCQWSCAFLNLVIAELLSGSTAAKAVDTALAYCAHRGDVNCDVIDRVRSASFSSNSDELTPGSHVLDTLECALWSLLHTDSFESAVIRAVNLGGDADSIGAVSGALAGAAYGADAIPGRWVELVGESDLMRDLAVSLVNIS